jgi:hypothetical protein
MTVKVFQVPAIVPQGRMRTNNKWQSWNVFDCYGKLAGFVVEWSFGYMAYDADGAQITNAASVDDAANIVLNPPALAAVDFAVSIPA